MMVMAARPTRPNTIGELAKAINALPPWHMKCGLTMGETDSILQALKKGNTMHEQAMKNWRQIFTDQIDVNCAADVSVLDVGSYDLNGTLKPLITEYGFKYTGLDIAPGPNVDVIADNPYAYPFESGVFDLVISNATLEHIKFKEVWLRELTRVCEVGGLVILMNPACMAYHADEVQHHRKDYWRVMPDGMKYLMEEVAGLVDVTVDHDDVYCWGVGLKTQ